MVFVQKLPVVREDMGLHMARDCSLQAEGIVLLRRDNEQDIRD
jgi:hypothetical protein